MRHVYVALPLDILDGIWPQGVTLLTRRKRRPEAWIDTLEREVDRGLLRRTGNGTKDSPFEYVEVMPGSFARSVRQVSTFRDHRTRRLLARLGLSDAR